MPLPIWRLPHWLRHSILNDQQAAARRARLSRRRREVVPAFGLENLEPRLMLAATLADPGFELSTLASGQYQVAPSGTAWTFSGASGIAANGSTLLSGGGGGGGGLTAPQGTQVAYLGGPTSSITQSFTCDTTGFYALAFDVALPGAEGLRVLVDNQQVDRIAPGTPGTPGSAGGFADPGVSPFTILTATNRNLAQSPSLPAGGLNTHLTETSAPVTLAAQSAAVQALLNSQEFDAVAPDGGGFDTHTVSPVFLRAGTHSLRFEGWGSGSTQDVAVLDSVGVSLTQDLNAPITSGGGSTGLGLPQRNGGGTLSTPIGGATGNRSVPQSLNLPGQEISLDDVLNTYSGTVPEGYTLVIDSGMTLSGQSLTVSLGAGLDWTAGNITLTNGAQIVNAGLIQADLGVGYTATLSSAETTAALVNTGGVAIDSGALALDAVVDNQGGTTDGGTIEVAGGTLALGSASLGASISGGGLFVDALGTLTVTGHVVLACPVTNAGVLEVKPEANLDWGGGDTGNLANMYQQGAVVVDDGATVIAAAAIHAQSLAIYGNASVTISPPYADPTQCMSVLSSLTLAADTSGSPTLDLGVTDVIIRHGAEMADGHGLDAVCSWLRSAFGDGTWHGAGLTSSAARSGPAYTAVGYAEANEDWNLQVYQKNSGTGVWQGVLVNWDDLLIKVTEPGDGGLRGAVGIDDLGAVLNTIGSNGDWAHSNFHYGVLDAATGVPIADGVGYYFPGAVDFTDVNAVFNNVGSDTYYPAVSAPANLALSTSAGNSPVTLTWSPAAATTPNQTFHYYIYRGTSSGGEDPASLNQDQSTLTYDSGSNTYSYTDSTAESDVPYYYTVVADDASDGSFAGSSNELVDGVSAFWTGGHGSSWTEAANWSNGLVPGAATSVTLSGASVTYSSSGPLTVHDFTLATDGALNLTGGQLTIAGAAALDGAITVGSGAALDLQGTWSNSGSITVNGGTVQLGGSFTTADLMGTSNDTGVIYDSGQMDLTGDLDNSSNTGALVLGSGRLANLTLGPGAMIVGGTVTVNSQETLSAAAGAGGTVTLAPGTFTNNGTINVTSGILNLEAGGWSNPGAINVAGGVLDLGGSFTRADLMGTSTTTGVIYSGVPGSQMVLTGTLDNSDTTDDLVLGSGRLAHLALGNGGYIFGGTVDNNGALVVGVGSTFSLQADLVNDTNATLTVAQAATLWLYGANISGGAVANAGSINYYLDTQPQVNFSAALTNTGQMNVHAPLELTSDTDNTGGTIDAWSTITLTGATFTGGTVMAWCNSHLIVSTGGTLRASNGPLSAGSVVVDAGGALLAAEGGNLSLRGLSITHNSTAAMEGGMLNQGVRGGTAATEELMSAVRAHGRTIQIATEGSEELRYLDFMKANANAGGETMTDILLRENPTKVEVMEEFLHGTQFRAGMIDRLGMQGAEVQVKEFMLAHQRLLGLSEQDAAVLRQLLGK